MNNRSNESLIARREELIKAATSNNPETVIADINEILRLRAENERLEKEAEWLAARCHEFCDYNNYCNECALYPGNIDFPHPDCGIKLVDNGQTRSRFTKHTIDWRKAASRAVENG